MKLAILMAIATLGCSTAGSIPVVQSEYSTDQDFRELHRYAWVASDLLGAAPTQSEHARAHDLIQQIIDERMVAKGFVRSEASEADLWVTFQFSISEKTKVERIERVWVGDADDGADWEDVVPRVELSSFDEGSIVIDFLKPGSGTRVWRGVARGRVSRDAKQEQLDAIVSRSVRSILGEFPPQV